MLVAAHLGLHARAPFGLVAQRSLDTAMRKPFEELYDARYPVYLEFTKFVRPLVEACVAGTQMEWPYDATLVTVESRTKNPARWKAALQKVPGDELCEERLFDDACGLRVVVPSEDYVPVLLRSIGERFVAIREKRSLPPEPDRFGYRDWKVIVALGRFDADRFPDVTGRQFRIEVQIRTMAADMWAKYSHRLDYKGDVDLDPLERRRLFRVGAVLELVDKELGEILQSRSGRYTSYRTAIGNGDLNHPINIDSLHAFCWLWPFGYWHQMLGHQHDRRELWVLSELLEIVKRRRLKSLGELDAALESAQGVDDDRVKDHYSAVERAGGTPVLRDDELICVILRARGPDTNAP